MASGAPSGSKGNGSAAAVNMFNMLKAGTLAWGNVVSSPAAVAELGLEGARAEKARGSPHRASSGQTSEIQRIHGRKGRKEHYTRKAILEKEKEEARRVVWLRRHPGAPEANWDQREEKRKTHKAKLRMIRKWGKIHKTTGRSRSNRS
jgi:hypothetical protein